MIGLFVDDAGFAAAIIAWLALVAVGHLVIPIDDSAEGFAVFGGLALILVVSAVRRARK